MKSGVFFPYRTSTDAISLTVTGASTGIHVTDASIDAYTEAPDSVELTLTVDIDLDAIRNLIHESEDPDQSCSLLIRTQGIRSRERSGIQRPLTGQVQVQVVMNRSDWSGSARLTALVVRQRDYDAVTSDNRATDRGAALAWSEDLVIQFDEPDSTGIGGHLEVNWRDFKEDPVLMQSSAHLFGLTQQADGRPAILLNSGFHQAYAVLSSKGNAGSKARIRDATFYQVAHQAWSSILSNAYMELRSAATAVDRDAGPEGSDLLEELDPWHAQLLRDWAIYLFPGMNQDDAVNRVAESALDDSPLDFFLLQLPRAIQGRLETWKGFEGLVRQIGLFDSAGEE